MYWLPGQLGYWKLDWLCCCHCVCGERIPVLHLMVMQVRPGRLLWVKKGADGVVGTWWRAAFSVVLAMMYTYTLKA